MQGGRTGARRLMAAILSWLLPAVGLLAGLAVAATPAQALPITVKVTVEKIEECCGTNFDDAIGPDADFAGFITVQDQTTEIPEDEGQNVSTPNITGSATVDHTLTQATARIEVYEVDGTLFNGGDDDADITPASDTDSTPRFVNMVIDLHPDTSAQCNISGNVTGICGQTLTSEGSESGMTARVTFKVVLEIPVTAPNSHVRCTHTPAWPQTGDTVTFTAESLADQPAADPGNAALAAPLPPKVAQNLEIWYSTDGGVTRNVLTSINNTTTETGTAVAGNAGTTFSYGCRANTEVGPIFTGWRSVSVGNPPSGNVVSLSVGESERKNALDIVLVPATRTPLNNPLNTGGGRQAAINIYTGPADPDFLTEAARILRSEIFRHQVLLDGQRRINLWLLLDANLNANATAVGGVRDVLFAAGPNAGMVTPDTTPADGIPDGDGNADICHVEMPANAATDASWSNATALIHDPDNGLLNPPVGGNPVDSIRDCAPGARIFTNEAGEVNLLPHELGHAGFGMADEYCCDGGYFQPNPFPNTFLSLAACQNDPLYSATPAVCDGYDRSGENPENATNDFWVGDPSDADGDNDLMNNNQTPQAADIRRINWVLNTECPAGRC